MEKVRMGIIGMGSVGCKYARIIAAGEVPGMELAAVTRIRKDLRKEATAFLPEEIPLFQTAEELLEYDKLDAVLIATPHYAHEEQTIQALRKGLHVLCDKPSGVYAAQAVRMNEEADKHDLVFAMMFNQRTNPVYRKMKELLETGKYGGLKRINWIITNWYRPEAYYRAGSWRATWAKDGGGVLLNQCPHNLDLLQWICGMPCRVQAFCHEGKWHDIEVEDDVTAYMEFENGATGVFITSTGDAPGTNRLELDLDGAQLVCENNELRIYELSVSEPEFRKTAADGFAKPEGHFTEVVLEGEATQHTGILRNFAEAILHKEPLIARGEEGLNSLMLSNAMYLSSWEKRMVELPIDNERFYDWVKKKCEPHI